MPQEYGENAEGRITPDNLGQGDSLSDLTRFTQARRIGDIVFEYVEGEPGQGGIWMRNNRDQEPNPCLCQTLRGFFLEITLGSPNILWTPWGQYVFGGGGTRWPKEPVNEILDRLRADMYKRTSFNETTGIASPIYAVHEVDGILLPNPIERPKRQYIPPKKISEIYKSLVLQYLEIKRSQTGI